ncbi:hypothetical protein KBA41_14585 [Candidatus Ozemobacteraceae bacterium]|nr:hypothetical protein [Candidatus Ozemobacteraceae bacterium]
MSVRPSFRYLAFGVLLPCCALWSSPIQAASLRDGSGKLRDRARVLAESFPKESRYEAQLRLSGRIQEADRKPFTLGDDETFFVQNFDTMKKGRKAATLVAIGKHCLVYVEKGQKIRDAALKRIVDWFDMRIYPTNTRWFGSEWTPGIDHEPKITLLFLEEIQQADGFFDPEDEYTREKCPESNEREMLYLSIARIEDIDDMMGNLVSHEFQHLIHWNHDAKETFWVEEGLAEFSSSLHGSTPFTMADFFAHPSRNLTDWEDTEDASNYGHAFLFVRYLLTHACIDESRRQALTRTIVDGKQRGMTGVSEAFRRCNVKKPLPEFFRDFSAALYLNRSRGIEPGSPLAFDPEVMKMTGKEKNNPLKPVLLTGSGPFEAKGKVKMWSSTALEVSTASFPGKTRIDFAAEYPRAATRTGKFDLGVAFVDSRDGSPAAFTWLGVDKNAFSGEVRVPAGYRRMVLIISNQGPVRLSDQEKPLPPVAFRCSIGAPADPGTASRGRPAGRTDRRSFQRMLTAYSSSPEAEYEEAVIDVLRAEFDRDPAGARALLENAVTAIESEAATGGDVPKSRQALGAIRRQFEGLQGEKNRFESLHREESR